VLAKIQQQVGKLHPIALGILDFAEDLYFKSFCLEALSFSL
jgi:hypothetical protein